MRTSTINGVVVVIGYVDARRPAHHGGRPAAGSASMWPTSGVGVGAFGAQLQAGVGVDHRAVAQRLGELELVRPERCGVAAGRGVSRNPAVRVTSTSSAVSSTSAEARP